MVHGVLGTTRSSIHLRPAAELAERVLLPGDPHRALSVAQSVLATPRMFNHHRGLWGYTGEAPDGRLLTVQATGMGGPSAALVVEELIDLGARELVRIGTCGALVPELELGDMLVAVEVIPADGASTALGASGRVLPDARLTEALLAPIGGGRAAAAKIVSTDLFYDERDLADRWIAEGGVAVEMETAAVLQVARRRGVAAACLLAVSDLLGDRGGAEGPARSGDRSRIAQDALEAVGVRMGERAAAAFAGLGGAGAQSD